MEEDFYKILSVDPGTPRAKIQEQVRRLTRFYSVGKDGIYTDRQKVMLSQIKRASEILTDPIRRLEYDLQSGYKKHSTNQKRLEKLRLPPVKYSESKEALTTLSIPGELDMNKLEKSLSSVQRVLLDTKFEEKAKANYRSPSTYRMSKTERNHSDFKSIKHAKDDFTKNELSEDAPPTKSPYNKEPVNLGSFQVSKNEELKAKSVSSLEIIPTLESKQQTSPAERTKFLSDTVQVLSSHHKSKKINASETKSAHSKSGSEGYLTSLPFDVKDYTTDETSNKIGITVGTEAEGEEKTSTKESKSDSLPIFLGEKISDFSKMHDMMQKQLCESSTASQPTYVEHNELNSHKTKDIKKEGIGEVIIRGDFKEPIYLIDEEKMELSSANLRTETGTVIKMPNIFPSNSSKFKHEEDHYLKKINSDDGDDDKNKKLHSVRSFALNTLNSETKLEEEPVNNYETENLKNKSLEIKRLMHKPNNEECMHQLGEPLSLQLNKSQENQQEDPSLVPSRKCSAKNRYDIKRVDSIKLIGDLCNYREVKASEYQHEKALSLQHEKNTSYSPKLQNAIQLLEETSKRFSNGNILSKPISEDLKCDTSQSFKGESNFGTSEKNSHSSYEESHSEAKFKNSSINSSAQNISMINSEIEESRKITLNKTKDNGKDICTSNDTFCKEESNPRHNIGLDKVLPRTSQSIYHDNSKKTEETGVSKIKFETDEQIIPLKENPENNNLDAKHVDSLLVTKVRFSRRQTKSDLTTEIKEFSRNLTRNLSLPQERELNDYYSSYDFQNALQLLKIIRSISKENKIRKSISDEETERICTDEWQDIQSDAREANMLTTEINPPITLKSQSKESETKLFNEIMLLVDCLKQKISDTDLEKCKTQYHRKDFGLITECKSNAERVSSQESSDGGNKSEAKNDNVAENLETDCSRSKEKHSPEKRPPRSIDSGTLEMEYPVYLEGQSSNSQIKQGGLLKKDSELQNDTELSKPHNKIYCSKSLLLDGEERRSYSGKLLNDFKLLEESKKLSRSIDTVHEVSSKQNKLDTVVSDCPFKTDASYTNTTQIHFHSPVGKTIPKQSIGHFKECGGICLTDSGRSEHNGTESMDKSQEIALKVNSNGENKIELVADIPVESKSITEFLKSDEPHSSKNADKEDPTASDDIFISTEKTISKPCLNKQTKSDQDERQFQKRNLRDIFDDEDSALNTDFSTVKPNEKNTLNVWSKDSMSSEADDEEPRDLMPSEEDDEETRDPMPSVEDDEEPRLQNVSATTRIAGANIRTVYHFDHNTEFIEVFVNDDLKAKIVKDEKQDIFCNAMKHDDLPEGVQIFASTVIAANDCIITTEVSKREKRQTIAVYKNDEILFRSGNTVLD